MAVCYLDHDVASDVARLLRQSGHDLVTVREPGTTRDGDERHVLAAAQAGRVLVSLNRKHYLLLHLAWQAWSSAWGTTSQHSGMLLLPHAAPAETVKRIINLLSTDQPMAGCCYECDIHGRWSGVS